MKGRSVKRRVRCLLLQGLIAYEDGQRDFAFLGADQRHHLIKLHDGFIAQSIFADPKITGSTEGKRRLRELRNDPEVLAHFFIQMRNEGRSRFGYRLRRREHILMHHARGAGKTTAFNEIAEGIKAYHKSRERTA